MGATGILVNGQLVTIPGVYPEVDTSAMVPFAPTGAKTPLVLGMSDGGDPDVVYTFTNYDQAKAVLRGGRALSYLARVFNPSPEFSGAPRVKYIRMSSSAARSSWDSGVGDGHGPLYIYSRGVGAWTTGIRFGLVEDLTGDTALPLNTESPTNYKPWTATISLASEKKTYTYRIRNGLKVTGVAGGQLLVDRTTETFTLMDGIILRGTASFSDLPTLGDVANWITAHGETWAATVIGPKYFPSSVLDNGTYDLATTPYFIPAQMAALAFMLNASNPLVYAVMETGTAAFTGIAPPINLVNGAGRANDTLVSDDVTKALSLAATTSAQGIFIQTCDSGFQALARLHTLSMNSPEEQRYRIFFAGINFTGSSPVDGASASAATEDDAVTAALAAALDLDGPVVLAFNGTTHTNPDTGKPEQLGGLGLAAEALGLWAGLRVKEPLTHKAVISSGLEFPNLSTPNKEALLEGGVFAAYFDEDSGRTRILQAITTAQTTNPQDRNLQGLSIQHTINRMWLSVLSNYVGAPLDLETGNRIKTDAGVELDRNVASGSQPDGFLTEGRQNGTRIPAWDSLSVTGDSTTGTWEISVNAHAVGETDFIHPRTKLTPVPIEL